MLSADLNNKANDYIAAAITLEQLVEWLVPRLPYFLRSPNSADADVVSAIELGLTHIADGLTTEDQFRQELQDELRLHTSIIYSSPQSFRIDATSINVTSPVTGWTPRNWASTTIEMSISIAGARQ